MKKSYQRDYDYGSTKIFGGGLIKKDSPLVEAYGNIDELVSVIGFARAIIIDDEIKGILKSIQKALFMIGSDLATPLDKKSVRLTGEQVDEIERFAHEVDTKLPALNNFILPGESEGSSMLHIARSVCRRVERRLVTVHREEEINKEILRYMNRLSDLLFDLARLANIKAGIKEDVWSG